MTDEAGVSSAGRPLLRIVQRRSDTRGSWLRCVAVLAARGGVGAGSRAAALGLGTSRIRAASAHLATHPGAWRESGFAQGVRTRADW